MKARAYRIVRKQKLPGNRGTPKPPPYYCVIGPRGMDDDATIFRTTHRDLAVAVRTASEEALTAGWARGADAAATAVCDMLRATEHCVIPEYQDLIVQHTVAAARAAGDRP